MSLERTSRYIFGVEGLLFLSSFRMHSVRVNAPALTQTDVGMCTGKCARREQTIAPCGVCLWICRVRLECEEQAFHKPTGTGDDVKQKNAVERAS